METNVQPSPPPRSRSSLQFSLRTLLIVTTIVAIGCWWFLRPPVFNYQIAGKYLQLRRQVRLVPDPAKNRPAKHVNVGHWQLRDDQGNLLVNGHYNRDRPDGWWTTYHANGRKAVQGKLLQGEKVGWWRTWDDTGRLTSEVQHPKRTAESKAGR